MVGRHSYVTWRRRRLGRQLTLSYRRVVKVFICITFTTVMLHCFLDSTPRASRSRYSLEKPRFVESSPSVIPSPSPLSTVACLARRKLPCFPQTPSKARKVFVTSSPATSVRKFTREPNLQSISSQKFLMMRMLQDSHTTSQTFVLSWSPSRTTVRISRWHASKQFSECVSPVRPYALLHLP